MLILVWLLSFNPYAVLVAGQNLLGRCCSPMNQSSVNMVTTDDENSLSFQCSNVLEGFYGGKLNVE